MRCSCGVLIALGLGACADPDPGPVSTMTIGDRTVTFDVSSVVGTGNNLAKTFDAHSPASGPITEQVHVFVTASGDGVIAHDYPCNGPNMPTVMVVDLGVEYAAGPTQGTCVFTYHGDLIPDQPLTPTADLFATVVSGTGASLNLRAHIAARYE